MSINQFLSNFKGGAPANRFKVQITWPGAVGSPNVRDEFVVNAAQHPASVLGQIPVAYQGRQIPIPGDRTFEDWTITVVNDKSYSHRSAFERWSNVINSHEGNIQGADTLRDMVSTIDVHQLDRDGSILKTYKLYNAWPNNVSPIELSYDQNDVLQTFTVTFAYSHWHSPTSVVN